MGLSVFALYWVVAIVDTHVYRAASLLLALAATFILYPARRGGRRDRVPAADWALVALTVAAFGWPIVDRAAFAYRSATPTPADLALGVLAIALVLEATRRTAGWVLTVTAAAVHRLRLRGPAARPRRAWRPSGIAATTRTGWSASLYMSLDGIFGVPLDVAATYIILFTLYGAVLEHSGAGRFFIDWSLSAMGRSRSAGRARARGDAGRLPPRHRLRQRRGHHGDPGLAGLADPPPRRLRGGDRGRDLRRRRHRRDPLPADARARPRSCSPSSSRSRTSRC